MQRMTGKSGKSSAIGGHLRQDREKWTMTSIDRQPTCVCVCKTCRRNAIHFSGPPCPATVVSTPRLATTEFRLLYFVAFVPLW
jgi:hypothetical protein